MKPRYFVTDGDNTLPPGVDAAKHGAQSFRLYGFVEAEHLARMMWRQVLGRRKQYIHRIIGSTGGHHFWTVINRWEWYPDDDSIVYMMELLFERSG